MIHLIWHSYIKRVKLLISATLLPNLLYLDDHLTPTSEHLADPVEELEHVEGRRQHQQIDEGREHHADGEFTPEAPQDGAQLAALEEGGSIHGGRLPGI